MGFWAHTYSPSNPEVEAGGSEVSGHPWLHSLGYMRTGPRFSFPDVKNRVLFTYFSPAVTTSPNIKLRIQRPPRKGSLYVKIREIKNPVVWESRDSRTHQGESPVGHGKWRCPQPVRPSHKEPSPVTIPDLNLCTKYFKTKINLPNTQVPSFVGIRKFPIPYLRKLWQLASTMCLSCIYSEPSIMGFRDASYLGS